MVIIGAAMNHWYHMDMNYRGVILNILMMMRLRSAETAAAGHICRSGKIAPADWLDRLAFARWTGTRPPRLAHEFDLVLPISHSSQWRYEKLAMTSRNSRRWPTTQQWQGRRSATVAYVHARRFQLPTAPHFANPSPKILPPPVKRQRTYPGEAAGQQSSTSPSRIEIAVNFPRNHLFVWHSQPTVLPAGSTGAIDICSARCARRAGRDWAGRRRKAVGSEMAEGRGRGSSVVWVTLVSHVHHLPIPDIVLPTATWYERTLIPTTIRRSFTR